MIITELLVSGACGAWELCHVYKQGEIGDRTRAEITGLDHLGQAEITGRDHLGRFEITRAKIVKGRAHRTPLKLYNKIMLSLFS